MARARKAEESRVSLAKQNVGNLHDVYAKAAANDGHVESLGEETVGLSWIIYVDLQFATAAI